MKRLLLTAVLLLVAFSVLAVEEAAAQTGATATVTAWHLNVRDYPDPFVGNVIARIGRGEVYNVTARSSINHWWQLRLPDGRLGWVNGFYISVTNPHLAPSLDPRGHVPDSARGSVTAWHLNVRHIPNPFTGQIIARVGRSEVYPVVGRNADSSWWQIRLPDSRTGWVNGGYLTVTNAHLVPVTDHTTPTPPAPAPAITGTVVNAHFLNVRTAPSPIWGGIITVISRGQSYPAIGRNADSSWWQIRVGGSTGWVSGRYFSVPSGHTLPVTG
jgi:uncharacterized protein YgiM (DUF1202 family)